MFRVFDFVVLVLFSSLLAQAYAQDPDEGGGDNAAKIEEAQKESLEFINELRAKHSSPALVLDPKITAKAQKHAETMAAAEKLSLSCKSGCEYGENVAMAIPNADLAAGVKSSIQRWYDVSATYDYKAGKGTTTKSTYSFTQMIWKSTKKAGIGIAVNPDSESIYIVALFSPPGNTMGSFQKNVLPPGAADEPEDEVTTESPDDQESEDPDDGGTGPFIKPTTPQSVELQRLVKTRLREMRARHGVQPLDLNVYVVNSAQKWAESLATSGKLSVSCNSKCKYGENVGMQSAKNMLTAINATLQRWYDESAKYDYKAGQGSASTGDFTALVWKSSVKFGIGIAKRRANKVFYVVFQFDPPGNVLGKYIENVLPPTKAKGK